MQHPTHMMRLAVVTSLLFAAACQQNPSPLDNAGGGRSGGESTTGGGALSEDDQAALSRIEERIAAIESATKARFGGDGKTEAPIADRLQRLESTLTRYGEALEFLQRAYEQNKAQQEAQEANEPDPNAVFAVNITGPLAAGQVDGPNSALVTIVEAWDFA